RAQNGERSKVRHYKEGDLAWSIELRVLGSGEPEGAGDGCDDEDCRAQQAAFRTDGAAGEPNRPGGAGVKQMTRSYVAAVGYAVKIGFAPIKSHVCPNGHPEIAGAAEQEAGKQSKDAGIAQADPGFAGGSVMGRT